MPPPVSVATKERRKPGEGPPENMYERQAVMGIARWYFYGTQSWTDAEARRSLDHDKLPRHTLKGQIQRGEDRAARRRQARGKRRGR